MISYHLAQKGVDVKSRTRIAGMCLAATGFVTLAHAPANAFECPEGAVCTLEPGSSFTTNEPPPGATIIGEKPTGELGKSPGPGAGINASALAGMSQSEIAALLPQAMANVTADQIAMYAPQIMGRLSGEQIASLAPQVVG